MRHMWRKSVMISFNFEITTVVGLTEQFLYSWWRVKVLKGIATTFLLLRLLWSQKLLRRFYISDQTNLYHNRLFRQFLLLHQCQLVIPYTGTLAIMVRVASIVAISLLTVFGRFGRRNTFMINSAVEADDAVVWLHINTLERSSSNSRWCRFYQLADI